MEFSAYFLPLVGLAAGTLLGFVARKNFFCTLNALETHWYGFNSSGLRVWVFSAVLAAFFTQILVFTGMADVSESIYLTPNFAWLGAIFGGLVFGYGMALIGTCSFGALVRLDGGSLKSLIAVIFLGLSALSTQRGLLALPRTDFFDKFQLDFAFATNQSMPNIVSTLAGMDLNLIVTIVLIALPAIWVLKDKKFITSPKNLFTSFVIGAIVAFGWFITSLVAENSFDPVQVSSTSFVAPIGNVIFQFALVTGSFPDYGVGLTIGVVFGAILAARLSDNVRWEACGDARELKRHILGASLMGFGGILALGCTVGQAISAASLLTISAPITILSIVFGAKIGLAWLLEGSIKSAFSFK
ncbi:MAG: YeeE/YedE family protein [Nitratireductor sp.]